MDRRSLISRVLTAAVGIPLLLGAAWLGDPWWASVVTALCVLGVFEYGTLVRAERLFSYVLAAVVGPTVFLMSRPDLQLLSAWIVGAGAIVLLLAAFLPPVMTGNPQQSGVMRRQIGVAGIGWLYLGVAGGALAAMGATRGFSVLLWFFLTIWANDIAAYFVGHATGRHKLAPQLSPGKSWEGGIAGLIAGVAASLGLASWLPFTALQAALAGAGVTIAAQIGDLFESAIKRRAGVKDSGVIFPGHGGVLDRFDGVFAAAPVAYLLLHWWTS